MKDGCQVCREGVYRGHTGTILQLLCLGDHLLSLGSDGKLLLWKIGDYDDPQVLSTTLHWLLHMELVLPAAMHLLVASLLQTVKSIRR